MKKFSILFFVLVLSTVHSFAQDDIKNVDSLKYELDQVTISATRYPEKIIEVPYAVSIIPFEDLLNTKGYGLDEVLIRVPGVLAQSRDGNQDVRLVIRGFGARGSGDRSNSGTSRGIRVMMDGIPETEPDGRTSFDNIDLSLSNNIDVIRSNSSSLWGNASGGIINVSTIPHFTKGFVLGNGKHRIVAVREAATQRLEYDALSGRATNSIYGCQKNCIGTQYCQKAQIVDSKRCLKPI